MVNKSLREQIGAWSKLLKKRIYQYKEVKPNVNEKREMLLYYNI